jgi:hypothetical protein
MTCTLLTFGKFENFVVTPAQIGAGF